MKKVRLLGISLLLMFLVGCGDNDGGQNIDDLNNSGKLKSITQIQFYEQDDVAQNGWNYSGYHNMTDWGENQLLVQTVPYRNSEGELKKVKTLQLVKNNGEEVEHAIFCDKTDCAHTNDTCNGYFEGFESQIWSYDNKLYAVSNRVGKRYLVEISDDGSERKELFTIGEKGVTSDASNNTMLTFANGFVYVTELTGFSKNGLPVKSVRKYSLDGKSSEVLVKTTTENSTFDDLMCYGGNLFFTYYTKLYDKKSEKINFGPTGLYCYDTKTGELSRVIEGEVTGYSIDIDNKILYCYIGHEGLYKYDLTTGNREKIYEADDKTGLCDVYRDENYIYLDNYMSVGEIDYKYITNLMYMTSASNPHKLLVLSKDGEKLSEIINLEDRQINIGNCKDVIYMTTGNLYYGIKSSVNNKYMSVRLIDYKSDIIIGGQK